MNGLNLQFLESDDRRSVGKNDKSVNSGTRSTFVKNILTDETQYRIINIVEGEDHQRKVMNHIENSLPRRTRNYKQYSGGFGSTRCTGYGPSAAVQIYSKFYQTLDFNNEPLNTTSRKTQSINYDPPPVSEFRQQKLIKKYEILDSLIGSSREGKSIKSGFLKGLLSKSINTINVVSSIQTRKNLVQPDRDFAIKTRFNPVLYKKQPEQTIENINLKSRQFLLEESPLKSTLKMPQLRVTDQILSYNESQKTIQRRNFLNKTQQLVSQESKRTIVDSQEQIQQKQRLQSNLRIISANIKKGSHKEFSNLYPGAEEYLNSDLSPMNSQLRLPQIKKPKIFSRASLENIQVHQQKLVNSSSKEILEQFTTSRFLSSEKNSSGLISHDDTETIEPPQIVSKPTFQMPNPSSMKDLLVDHNFYIKLQMRLQDEQEDLGSNNKIKQMANGVKHIASGKYGYGYGSWNPNVRGDTASKKRNYNRMNQSIRMKNLKSVVQNQARTQRNVVSKLNSIRVENLTQLEPIMTRRQIKPRIQIVTTEAEESFQSNNMQPESITLKPTYRKKKDSSPFILKQFSPRSLISDRY